MGPIAFLWLLGAVSIPSFCGIEAKREETVDALRACKALPHLMLLRATKDIPVLECLMTDLTAMDASARTVTYTWHVKGKKEQARKDVPITFVLSNDAPDRGVAYINSDTSNPIPALAVYSDYKSCLIDKLFFGPEELCFQWVKPGTENSVPQACVTAMNEKCGGGVLVYTKDTCK